MNNSNLSKCINDKKVVECSCLFWFDFGKDLISLGAEKVILTDFTPEKNESCSEKKLPLWKIDKKNYYFDFLSKRYLTGKTLDYCLYCCSLMEIIDIVNNAAYLWAKDKHDKNEIREGSIVKCILVGDKDEHQSISSNYPSRDLYVHRIYDGSCECFYVDKSKHVIKCQFSKRSLILVKNLEIVVENEIKKDCLAMFRFGNHDLKIFVKFFIHDSICQCQYYHEESGKIVDVILPTNSLSLIKQY